MPSVRLYVTPEVSKLLKPEKVDDLFETLRQEVASTLGLRIEGVEAMWVTVKRAQNAAPVGIEVMYSVREGLKPKKKVRTRLSQNLSNLGLQCGLLPENVTEVAAWVLPQHDAIFTVAKLE